MEYSSLDSLKMVERRECDPRDSLHPLTVRGASARAQIRAHSTQTHTHEEIDAPLSRPGVLRWAVRFSPRKRLDCDQTSPDRVQERRVHPFKSGQHERSKSVLTYIHLASHTMPHLGDGLPGRVHGAQKSVADHHRHDPIFFMLRSAWSRMSSSTLGPMARPPAPKATAFPFLSATAR